MRDSALSHQQRIASAAENGAGLLKGAGGPAGQPAAVALAVSVTTFLIYLQHLSMPLVCFLNVWFVLLYIMWLRFNTVACDCNLFICMTVLCSVSLSPQIFIHSIVERQSAVYVMLL